MSKEVLRFKGLSLNRDEQSAGHGELSLCAGVELHDGALRPSVLEGSKVAESLTVDRVEYEGDGNGVIIRDTQATLLYVHETASYRHLIGRIDQTQVLVWFEKDGTPGSPALIHAFADDDEIISINSVGNTLVVLTKTGLYYVLWKNTESKYKYIGNKMPFIDIRFRPTAQKTATYDLSTFTNEGSEKSVDEAFRKIGDKANAFYTLNPDGNNTLVNIDKEDRSYITDEVWALINQANDTVKKDGHFYAPFLIRYCYRLYDGTTAMHSAPVFMNVSLPHTFRVYAGTLTKLTSLKTQTIGKHYVTASETREEVESEETTYYNTPEEKPIESINKKVKIEAQSGNIYETEDSFLVYYPNNVGIEFVLPNDDDGVNADNLRKLKEDWSDIIKSVDIFVSPMLVREKSGEQIKTLHTETGDMCGVRNWAKIYYTATRYITESVRTEQHFVNNGYTRETYETREKYINTMFDIPMETEEEYFNKIKDTNTFFLIKSINTDEGTLTVKDGNLNQYDELELDKNVVQNITSQELLKDEYHSHNTLFPIDDNSGMFVYNHRVNLYGMMEKLFEGFALDSMLNEYFTNRVNDGWRYNDVPDDHSYEIQSVYVRINTEDGAKYVKAEIPVETTIKAQRLCQSLLYYPDRRADEMVIILRDNMAMFEDPFKALILKMEAHNFLNGAIVTSLFWKDDIDDSDLKYVPVLDTDDVVAMPNKILTSEADNPYLFSVSGRNTVGIGIIKGVSAVTRALSQGQVGDHDLTVFATDGIWVLKVSSEGTYMNAHNISREVCSNPKSICQLDQSVVFATERSLSRFVESNVVSMSDMLDGPIRKWADILPGLTGYFPDAEHNGTEAQQLIRRMLDFDTPAVEMFTKGRVFYDYAGSRVIVLPAADATGVVAGEPDADATGVVAGTVAMVFSIRDQAWSTMPIPAIKAVVPGYPSPFVQLAADGSVIMLDKTYDYRQDGETIPGLIITRELTFSDTMDVIQGFTQYADSETAPVLFLFGSNDQRTWQPIGHSNRWFHNYLPGKPFRFFKVAVFMQMRPSEEYQQLQLEVVNKYAKL